MTMYRAQAIDSQLLSLITRGTTSGSICTFNTDLSNNLVNLQVAVTATGGGGTPSTPIPINGFSACDLFVNGTTKTISFGQTVYGGVLDVLSGKLTSDKAKRAINNLSWYGSNGTFYSSAVSDVVGDLSIYSDFLCSV